MPVGYRKPGRPKGSKASRFQITASDVGRGTDYLPVDYMLALMRDERCEASRRDAMAVAAAPFVHARLTAVATVPPPADGENGGDINIVQIFAVPRGAAFDVKSGTVTIEHDATATQAIEPYQGTPPLDADADAPQASPFPAIGHAEPLPVIELDTDNVTRLDSYRDKTEGD